MSLLNIEEHLNCFNYDISKTPKIEVKYVNTGEILDLPILTNQVMFLITGKIEYTFNGYPKTELSEGQFIFIPMNYKCDFSFMAPSLVVTFRLHNPVKLCERFFIENLFEPDNAQTEIYKHSGKLNALEMKEQISYFIKGVISNVNDGVRCGYYLEMKIQEFFTLLRYYYDKRVLRGFFSTILSRDISFSEYVKQNRNNFPTVIALAESMCLTEKQFSKRFREVFGGTPYAWMKEGRALRIRHEITTTNKPFKVIALENDFGTVVQFAKFCKKEFEKTPLQLRCEFPEITGNN